MGIGAEKDGDIESSILLVDDDDVLLAALQRALSRPNVRVKASNSGETTAASTNLATIKAVDG